MRVEFIDSINEVNAAQWNDISGIDYPFIRHEFLAALENSGCTNEKSGWQPYHALVYQHDVLCAVLPLYLKTHSYGEYVFDWSWADAYRQNGIPYYPKLVSSIPFTPSTGPRLCVKNADYGVVLATVFDAITQVCEQDKISADAEYKTLRRKHSAVESNINALERHALDRCPDRGIDNFKKYVSMSVLAHNIHQIGALVQNKMQKQNRHKEASISLAA